MTLHVNAAPHTGVDDRTNPTRRFCGVLLMAVLLALLLRAWAVLMLPVDFDEPIYLEAGYDYAQALRAGDWAAVMDYPGNIEHPALVKLLYAGAWLVRGPDAVWPDVLYTARAISALCGTLALLVVGLLDPWAALFFAVHTLAIKYTSQAYLEALPLFTSWVAVLTFVKAKSGRDPRLWLSALALGITGAGKFTYFPVIFPIAYLALREKRLHWRWLLAYVGVAALAFWAFNPILWRDPVGRLAEALLFHRAYSQSMQVSRFSYPWYQPLVWLSRSVQAWHLEVFFFPPLDKLIFWLGLAGLYWGWRKYRWAVVWLLGGLLFLLIWPTKWPQYVLLLVPLLCLLAPLPLREAYRWVRAQEDYWEWFKVMAIRPPPAFWVLSIAFLFVVTVGYMANNVWVTLERLKWLHVTPQNSGLPSNTIYDVLFTSDDSAIMTTEWGVVSWDFSGTTGSLGDWTIYNTANSPLIHNRVLDVLQDESGALWFATAGGLSRYSESRWETYDLAMLGLQGARAQALALGSDARVWVGTEGGIAAFDGVVWQSWPLDDFVFTLLVEPTAAGDRVWVGTSAGLRYLDVARERWTGFEGAQNWGRGVTALLLDSQQRLWAGTRGAGLGCWDGESWRFYRTANSQIPFNTVQALYEVEPGILWVGTAHPTAAGGNVSIFDGEDWRTFTSRNSGYSGAEPLVIVPATDGTLWIGTRTTGLEIYAPRR